MTFRNALPEDGQAVFDLYQEARGSRFCVWNEAYPGWEEIRQDLQTRNLYVLTENARIIGAVSIVPESELDDFVCWSEDGREIARVVISRPYQGRGLSGEMVRRVIRVLREKGCRAIHLSAAKSNLPACRTYAKLGFVTVGQARIYGNDYYLMEKAIGPPE